MPPVSSGLLMYKFEQTKLFVLLAHPGGPYFKNKDEGSWTIPKGLIEKDEDLLQAAIREFHEETSIISVEPYQEIGSTKFKNGKLLHGWGFQGDWEPNTGFASNTFEIEWPPRSGKQQTFPEIDQLEFFEISTARIKIHPVQVVFLDRLDEILNS